MHRLVVDKKGFLRVSRSILLTRSWSGLKEEIEIWWGTNCGWVGITEEVFWRKNKAF